MFERYTEKARRTIFFARYEASQAGSPYIEPEYLLLGVLREDRRAAGEALQGISLEQSTRELAPRVGEKSSVSVDLPLSPASRRALAYGAEEAEKLGHAEIHAGHLLLGLLREESRAAQFLRERGVELESQRRHMTEALSAGKEPVPRAAPRPEWGRGAFTRLGDFEDGRFSTSRVDNGVRVVESHNFVGGHEIQVLERIALSDDGKTLRYAIEIQGPGQTHRHEIEFEAGPRPAPPHS